MTLFTKAGDALNDEIIRTVFNLDLENIGDESDDFSNTIIPVGKFLAERVEFLLREECSTFLDNLSMHSKKGIFSDEEIEVKSFQTLGGKIGLVKNDSKQLHFCKHFDVPDVPVILRIQSLYEDKDDDYEPIVYCLFREVLRYPKRTLLNQSMPKTQLNKSHFWN